MRRELYRAMHSVGAEFVPGEKAADQTALHGLRCVQSMIEAGEAVGLRRDFGLEEIDLVMAAAASAVATRAAFARAHAKIGSLPQRAMDDGFGPSCPTGRRDTPPTLKAVGS